MVAMPGASSPKTVRIEEPKRRSAHHRSYEFEFCTLCLLWLFVCSGTSVPLAEQDSLDDMGTSIVKATAAFGNALLPRGGGNVLGLR